MISVLAEINVVFICDAQTLGCQRTFVSECLQVDDQSATQASVVTTATFAGRVGTADAKLTIYSSEDIVLILTPGRPGLHRYWSPVILIINSRYPVPVVGILNVWVVTASAR